MTQTWLLNETLKQPSSPISDIEFISNVKTCNNIMVEFVGTKNQYLTYLGSDGSIYHVYNFSDNTWTDEAYRTVVFETPPANPDALTWLKANATRAANKYLTTDVELSTVADAIRTKTGGTIELAYPDGYVNEINKLSDTSTDTVSAAALMKDLIAHDSSGKKITGTMTELNSLTYNNLKSITNSNGYFLFPSTTSGSDDYYYTKGEGATEVDVGISKGTFGDATAANVLKGKTFSSVEGVSLTGTYEPLDTSDATAAAGDMVKGKTAYVNGVKITGTIPEVTEYYPIGEITNFSQLQSGALNIDIKALLPNTGVYVPDQAVVIAAATDLTRLGTATKDQIRKGATFTSSAGFMATGTMPDASFANSATSGTTYTDISSSAPALVSDDYLYINKGYTDNVKISLAKLVPDEASGADAIKKGMLQNVTAYDNDGKLVAGNIASKSTEVFYPSTETQTIDAGKYLSGDQIIFAVATSGLAAENIVKGATITVGDSDNASRIASITGTADYTKTVTAVPTTKDTSIIYNSTTGKYYVWKD